MSVGSRSSEGVTGALKSSGYRVTQQRALLTELIETHSGHLDAETLYRRAKERDEHISLATVYRTLSLLKNLDLVDELHLSESHHHYEPKSDAQHYHLVCVRCGKVIEFQSPLVDRLQRAISGRYGFVVSSAQIDFCGYCPDCQREGVKGQDGL